MEHLDVLTVTVTVAFALVAGGGLALLGLTLVQRRGGRARPAVPPMTPQQRLNWRMPPAPG